MVHCSTSFDMQKNFNINTELIFKIITLGRECFLSAGNVLILDLDAIYIDVFCSV